MRRRFHQQLQVIGNSRRVLLEAVLAGPVCVAAEKHHAAAFGSKTAQESENQRCVGEMVHLKGLLVAIPSELHTTGQVPVVGVAHDAGERREFAVCDLSGEDTSEIVHS